MTTAKHPLNQLVPWLLAGMLGSGPVQAADAPTIENEMYRNALTLTPNIEQGSKLYADCVPCHGDSGWGDSGGSIPQIAGQHRGVIIKQMADIMAGHRDNPIMRDVIWAKSFSSPQQIADIAGYVAGLPMTATNGQGMASAVDDGRRIYAVNCAYCHGDQGEGDPETLAPRLQGQHFQYLIRQFEWIRTGQRRNANPEMVKQIENFSTGDVIAVMSWVAAQPAPADAKPQ